MTDPLCSCEHPLSNHFGLHETKVCMNSSCNCSKFTEYIPVNAPDGITLKERDYLTNLRYTTEKVRWLLEEKPFLRNYSTTKFVDWYRENVRNTEIETIRRTKQKLVEKHPERYGPTDSKLIKEKTIKQRAVEEWVKE